MKVYYMENDKAIVVYKGEFKSCLEFYINNKVKYKDNKKYISIGAENEIWYSNNGETRMYFIFN